MSGRRNRCRPETPDVGRFDEDARRQFLLHAQTEIHRVGRHQARVGRQQRAVGHERRAAQVQQVLVLVLRLLAEGRVLARALRDVAAPDVVEDAEAAAQRRPVVVERRIGEAETRRDAERRFKVPAGRPSTPALTIPFSRSPVLATSVPLRLTVTARAGS